MGIRTTPFILLIVDSTGKILASNIELKPPSITGKNANIGDFHFKPKLINILKSYQNTSDESLSDSQTYKVLDYSDKKRYTTLVRRITEDKNRIYSLELSPEAEDKIAEEVIGFRQSANENGQFLIIADGSGKIDFLSDSAKFFTTSQTNSEKVNNIYDLITDLFEIENIEEFRFALVDGKFWQADVLVSRFKDKSMRLKLFPVRESFNLVSSFMLFGDEISSIVKEKLAFSRARDLAKAVIDNIPGLIAILRHKDDSLILADANPTFLKTFTLTKSKVFNREIDKIFTADFVNLIYKKNNTATVKGQSYFEYTLTKKNTTYFGGKIVSLKESSGDENYLMIIMRDMTDILRYEKDLKKSYDRESYVSQLKTSFLINMATEIRTPFNSIRSYADMIDGYIEENDYDSVKELLDSSKEVLKRVVNLFANVTEVAQIEAGNVKIRKETLNCNELIKMAFSKIGDDIKENDLNAELKQYSGLLLISVDWVKIEHVISLLLDHSMKSSQDGTIRVETDLLNGYVNIKFFYSVNTFGGMDGGDEIESGVNVSITNDLSEVEELGITIASHYTKLMGGEFFIEKNNGEGSVIILSFPQVRE